MSVEITTRESYSCCKQQTYAGLMFKPREMAEAGLNAGG